MKLVHETNTNVLIRTLCSDDTNMPLLPGDMVRHVQDRASSGFVIAVSGDGRLLEGKLEALVLWSQLPFKGNYPPQPAMPASTNPCAEVALLSDLVAHNIVSKRTLFEALGFDPDMRPTDD